MGRLTILCGLLFLLCNLKPGICSAADQLKGKLDGRVLELDESNFDSAISSFSYILVDFYAPWCGHCKRLSPQLDKAAPILAGLKDPIVIAKLDADKFTTLARKYEIDGYPTLKLFIHGVPVDYRGPRKPDLLVRYLKKFVAPDVSILGSDSAISDFVEAADTEFPIYLGFGLNETVISYLAIKYKQKAWFSVAKDFSEDAMVLYDFDKVPALVVLHPSYNEQSTFYGPFEDEFLGDFIKQNLLPLAVPMNQETLSQLGFDDRKIVLTIMEDANEEKSQKLIKLLKAAASANHDLVFGYVGVKQWEEFADAFGANKNKKFPKLIIWNGDEEYFSVIGYESLDEEDLGSQISRFLEGYREGRTEKKMIEGPSFKDHMMSTIGIGAVVIFVFLVALLMLIRSLCKDDDEPRGADTRRDIDHDDSSDGESSDTEHEARKKED